MIQAHMPDHARTKGDALARRQSASSEVRYPGRRPHQPICVHLRASVDALSCGRSHTSLVSKTTPAPCPHPVIWRGRESRLSSVTARHLTAWGSSRPERRHRRGRWRYRCGAGSASAQRRPALHGKTFSPAWRSPAAPGQPSPRRPWARVGQASALAPPMTVRSPPSVRAPFRFWAWACAAGVGNRVA